MHFDITIQSQRNWCFIAAYPVCLIFLIALRLHVYTYEQEQQQQQQQQQQLLIA